LVRCGNGKDEGDGLWSFSVFVKQLGEAPEGESFVLAALEPEVFLIHKDGTRLAPNAGKNAKEEDEGLVVEYLISGAPGKMTDYQIVVRTPAGVSKIPVKFTLKDLPLP
jgi:hypothetical protein